MFSTFDKGFTFSLQDERRSRPSDVDARPRIKIEPKSESDSDSSSSDSARERKPRVKHEHKSERDGYNSNSKKQGYKEESSGSYDRRGHRERDLPVRVKQEPDSEEEMRQQREERRRHDQQRIDKRRRQDREERREDRQRQSDDSRRQDRGGNRDSRSNIPEDQRYGRRDDQQAGNSNASASQEKDAPDFKLSGKLTEDTNTYKGVVIKYNEPPEARKPKKRWRLYPFKNDEALKPFHMHRQSAYLFGRDRIIADIPIDHPSCSKQHAVFQYRMVPYEKPDGRRAYKIAPYIIDLESANGTFVNNKRIDDRVYVELMEKDVLKFGFSSREYVLLHDKSNTQEVESDVSD